MIKSKSRRVTITGTALLLCLGLVTAGSSMVSAGAAVKKVPGVTATRVTIGATEPLTGIASAGYDQIAPAMQAVFTWVNDHGGVNGRKIKFVVKDDCYGTPGSGCTGVPDTATQTHALLGLPVFATVGSLGTPTQDSVRALLRGDDVPQTFVSSGSQDWNNPQTYPGLFGWQPSYNEESKIFAKYINSAYPGAQVCFLGQDDDFGTDGLAGLVAGGVSLAVTDLYSVPALVTSNGASFGPYVAAFQTAKCTVVVLDTIPGATDAALGAALQLGYSPQWIISNVGSDPQTVDAPFVGKVPTDPEIGAITFSYLPLTTSSSPWIPWIRKVLTADDPEFASSSFADGVINGNVAYGASLAVSFVETLKAAGRDLTRASYLRAMQSTTFTQTPSLVPLRYTSSNHQGLNGGYLTTVISDTAEKTLTGTIYTTESSNTSPVVVAKTRSAGIPGWLK
jgi:ABC-type branched-subunit amino acid transport system substrate-binding protein